MVNGTESAGASTTYNEGIAITAEDLLNTRVRAPLSGSQKARIVSASHTQYRRVRNEHNCEVLGPSACQHCLESNSKIVSSTQRLHSTSDLIHSELLMVLRLQKCYPNDSQTNLEYRLCDGKVLPATLSLELGRRRDAIQKLSTLDKPTNQAIDRRQNEHRFFSDIDDLSRKIACGTIVRPCRSKQKTSLMDKLFPMFVSPKKLEKQIEKYQTADLATLKPPLLPVVSQNPPNHFFAGQKSNFKLPTPLPENQDYLKAIDSMTNSCTAKGDVLVSTFRSQRSKSRLNSSMLIRRPTTRSLSLSTTSRESTFVLSDTSH